MGLLEGTAEVIGFADAAILALMFVGNESLSSRESCDFLLALCINELMRTQGTTRMRMK
jgi:hypothetical protein